MRGDQHRGPLKTVTRATVVATTILRVGTYHEAVAIDGTPTLPELSRRAARLEGSSRSLAGLVELFTDSARSEFNKCAVNPFDEFPVG